ncbi:MAG: PilN domain-containing protein [Nitrospirae bacterium]|nr:PilN domain-containing protein [Nitrospirota bacterium]
MIRINLLSEEKKKQKKKRKIKGPSNFLVTVGIAALAALLVSGGAAFFFKNQVSQLKSRSDSNKAKLAELARQTNEANRLDKLNKEIAQRSVIIEGLRKNQSVPVKILDNVSKEIPEGLWLVMMTYKDTGVVVEGYAFSNADIVSYVENLKKSENFSDVYLDESVQAEIEKVQVYKFKLSFKIRV